jgi:hypothetical protein
MFPDAESMLALEPEELGAVLLEIQNGSRATFSQAGFIGPISRAWSPQWPQQRSSEIQHAIAEAFAWLGRAGLIMKDFTQNPTSSGSSDRFPGWGGRHR